MDIQVTPAAYTDMAGNAAKETAGFVFFHEVVDEDKAASAAAGRPIARSRIFIKHITPGDTLLEVDKPMKQGDEMKYPQQWAAFQAKRSQVISGTPLEMWPQLSTKEVFEFKAANIFTVEQLVKLPDQFAAKIMGYHQLKKKAETFLQLANDAQMVEKKDAQITELTGKLAELEKQVRELTSSLSQPVANRGGRPKGSKNRPKPLDGANAT